MDTKLCMISIKVPDIKKGLEFYCEKLNFKVEKEYGDNIVELNANGLPIILEKVSENSKNSMENSQVVVGLQTQNLKSMINELKKSNVDLLYEEPQKCPPGHYTVITDPFGNNIELLEFAK